jgi:hypothetical protein
MIKLKYVSDRLTRFGEFSPTYWAIFRLLGDCLLLAVFLKKLCATFPRGYNYVIIVTKGGLGYILGDFFANSSGHSGFGHTCKNVYQSERVV